MSERRDGAQPGEAASQLALTVIEEEDKRNAPCAAQEETEGLKKPFHTHTAQPKLCFNLTFFKDQTQTSNSTLE